MFRKKERGYKVGRIKKKLTELEIKKAKRLNPERDYQVIQAVNYLKSFEVLKEMTL